MADQEKKQYLSEDEMGFGAAAKPPKYLSEADMGLGPADGGFVASAKQSVGSLIKGAGQAAADFIPGVSQGNAVQRYGQSVIDANPTAVHSLSDIADKPVAAVKEAAGNAAGSIGGMIGARVLGNAITAAAPLTGPAAPVTAAVGQGVAWLGPWAAAALPSFGGIRDQQVKDDPSKQDSIGAKALAAAGAGTVGLIENKFGPQEWALRALSQEGRKQLAEKFAAKSLVGSIGKGVAKGAAVEGAEELAQNPIEQLASYQNPTTADNLQDTAFSGVMGALGGGVFGGGMGAASRIVGGEGNKPAPQPDPAAPAPAPAPILDAEAMQRAGVMPPPVLDDQQISRKVDLSGVPDDQGQAGAAAGEPAPTDLRQTIEDTTGISGRAAPGGSRLKDLKAAFDEQIEPQVIIDDSGKVTTTTNKLEFQQFQADYENRVALRQRNIEAGRRLHAAKAGINPDDGPLSAGAAIALELAASGQQDQSPAAEAEAPTPTPSPQAAPTGSFGAMNDFADLLDQERQDVTQRRAGIAERQGQRRAFDMAEADRRTAESMQREAQARRRAVLDSVLADPETKNPAGRFAAMLRREGYRDSAPTEDELRTIQRFEDVRAAQPAPPEVEPSAPNELDPAAMGIRERRAPAPPKNLREGMARAQAARAAEGGSMPQAAQPTAAPGFDPGKAWASLDTKQRADLAGRLQGVPPIVSKNVPRAEWGKINPALRAKLAEAMALRAAAPIEGADLGDGWAAFRPESGTAGVPRAEMPQIKAEHRGAMVNFMNARGVAHQEETLPASSLKPTQAEFSREKVARAAGFEGGDRAILVSSDNHILDGHHQWMAAREKGEDVRAIRLNAPIRDLIGLAHDFPSSTKAGGASGPAESTGTRSRAATAADDLRAMSRDAGWSERGGQLIRDAAGNATGRTKWLPRAEWFMAGMEPDPETLARDIDRFAAGEKVPAKSRRTIEGMLDWLDAQRSEPRLDEDASAYDFEAAGLDLDASEETLLIGDIFAEAALQDEAAVMRALGFTEEEIQDVVGQKASREGPRGAGQDGAGRAQEAGEVARSNAQPQGEAGSEGSPEGLTSYTNEDIARREAEAKAREEAKAAADKAADQKAQADAERDTFTLTGSDRPADVLATQGQGGLFDAPAPATQNPIKNENRAKAGPTAETSPPDQSPIKNSEPASPSVGNAPSPLEALFSDLNSDSARKANKARKAAAKLPEAARIEYVQANFHDLLIQLMDAGKLEVNGATTLTEDNASCL